MLNTLLILRPHLDYRANFSVSILSNVQGGSGIASNIKFQNIVMQNVANPIIIDQNYCDQDKPCKEQVKNFLVRAIYTETIKQYMN